MSEYLKVVDYCKRYNETPPTRFGFWFQQSPLSALTDKHFSIGCRIWLFFGRVFDYQRKWDKVRDDSLRTAKEALEQAFTPQLKKMLEGKLNDKAD